MKEENNTYEIYYDKEADFLEVFLGEPSNSYAEEIEEGIFIRRDEKTNDIKSIGILSFKKRAQILSELLHKFNIQREFNIKFM